MKKIIQKILGIDTLIAEQKRTNVWLERIARHSKKSSDLQERYNNAYHIK